MKIIMSLQLRIASLLGKLNDTSTMAMAEKELKALLVSEIDDGEKLGIMINCIGDEREQIQVGKKGKQNQLRLFISIAETFQHQIVEYLPRIFGILNKRIRGGDSEAAESVSETYGGIFEFAFRDCEAELASSVFRSALASLFELGDREMGAGQKMSALSLARIVQNCPLDLLAREFGSISNHAQRSLASSQCRAVLPLLEVLLSLALSCRDRVGELGRSLPSLLIRHLGDEDSKVRKACLDIFYAILVVESNSLNPVRDQIFEVFQTCKTDKAKQVREAALECLKALGPKKRDESVRKAGKVPALNSKINLDHVTPTIKRENLNSEFIKNKEKDQTEVLFKEPKVKIDYNEFMKSPEPRPVSPPPPPSSTRRVLQGAMEVEEAHSTPRPMPPEPYYPSSNQPLNPSALQALNPSILHPINPSPNPSVLGSQSNGPREASVPAFETFNPKSDSNSEEMAAMRKYIKVLNNKIKELQFSLNNVQMSNNFLISKVELLEKAFTNFSMAHNPFIPTPGQSFAGGNSKGWQPPQGPSGPEGSFDAPEHFEQGSEFGEFSRQLDLSP